MLNEESPEKMSARITKILEESPEGMSARMTKVLRGLSISALKEELGRRKTRELAAKRNRAFAKMSPAKKRVTVARDVLDQLKDRRLQAKFGVYLDVKPGLLAETKGYSSYQLDELLEGETCEVCGIGSLFVAAVDRANDCKVGDMDNDLNNSHFIRGYLGKFFSQEQLVLIETAFEGSVVTLSGTNFNPYSEPVQRAKTFSTAKSADSRLKRIMQNIIDNDGEFVPTRKRSRR